MSEPLQNNFQMSQNKMSILLSKISRGWVKSMISSYQQTTNRRQLKRLHTFESITAKSFYQIMKTNDYSLLLLNKRKKANENILFDRWLEILETYFLKTDPVKFRGFLTDMQNRAKMENQLITISAALKLKRFRITEGDEALKEFGITNATIEQVERKISVLSTKLNFMIEKQQKQADGVANADFYHLKAKYQKTVGTIERDILLIEWLGIIEEIREMNKVNPKP